VLATLRAALADRYRLERELGQGGMATVCSAHELRHDRDSARKLVSLTSAEGAGTARFALMRDAPDDVRQRRLAIVARLSPAVRLRLALDASELARRLSLTRLRTAHPALTQRELVARWLQVSFPALDLPVPRR